MCKRRIRCVKPEINDSGGQYLDLITERKTLITACDTLVKLLLDDAEGGFRNKFCDDCILQEQTSEIVPAD